MNQEANHRIDVSRHDDCLQIVLAGRASVANAGVIADEVLRIVGEEQARLVLIDTRPLLGRLGVVDTYFHVRTYPRRAAHAWTAVIDLPENESHFSFHETAAANLGFQVRFFSDSDAALAWLRSRPGGTIG